VAAANLPDAPADKIFMQAIASANIYHRSKFQLRSSIGFGDMTGGGKIKSGAADLSRRLLAKRLYGTLVLVNAYRCAKFQLLSSISFGDMEEVSK